MKKQHTIASFAATILMVVVLCHGAFAQEEAAKAEAPSAEMSSDELALAIGNAQKANMGMIKKHSWKSGSDLIKDGEKMASVVNEMRFDSKGELDVTNISAESSVKKQRGLRGRRQESEMEEFQDYLIGVLQHSYQYIFLSKGAMVDIFDTAEIKQSEESIDVAAASVFAEGDELKLSVAPGTYLTKALSFTTTLGEDTITGKVSLTLHESGLNTPASIEIEVPTQALKINTETYDWTSQE